MADKAEKPKAEAPAAAPADKKATEPAKGAAAPAASNGGLLAKTPVLLGGAMIIEAAVLFAGFKFLGGGHPMTAAGAELTTEEKVESSEGGEKGEKGKEGAAAPVDKKKAVEVPVVELKAPNKVSGRTFLYDIKITILTKGAHQEKVEETIKRYQGLIQDRIRTIIAQSDPEKLGGASEPGLETLRRQVKYQLDEIVGEGLIDEILVPRCIPFRTDY
jgi:flagellar basal body-associated protein FliL